MKMKNIKERATYVQNLWQLLKVYLLQGGLLGKTFITVAQIVGFGQILGYIFSFKYLVPTISLSIVYTHVPKKLMYPFL